MPSEPRERSAPAKRRARERVGESEGRSPSDTRDPRIDDLRQRLRSLGYLDAGVDRFVLGPARGTRSPAAIALLASLRIGALAAVLLGPAAAIGLMARLPGLVTGPRDALVVAVYLGAFFGVAVAAAAFAASLIVSSLARRITPGASARSGRSLGEGGRLSRIAGVMVTLLSLTYLTLWWQKVIAGVGWSAPLWTASALAVAAAISLLLGHAVTVGASAVAIAAAGSDAERTGDAARVPMASWRTTIATGVVAFGGAALLLTVSAGGASRDTSGAPPALTVVPSGLRVRVLAIDGFDARIFDELSSAGRVPALTSAFQAAFAQLESADAPGGDPARVWTTVATGQRPEVHGVEELETRRLAGVQGTVRAGDRSALGRAIRGATDLVRLTRPAIASGSERRAKTFWEVAAEAGLRTVVVNWWATWPARADGGVVLSDRATLRLEHGGPLDAELAPAELYDALKRKWPDMTARARAAALKALGPSSDFHTRPLLERSAELDALQIALLSEVASETTDLSVVYLPGLDIAQHALLGSQPVSPAGAAGDPRTAPAASALAARLEALKQYYAALDRLVAPLLMPRPNDLVFVVTGSGRVNIESGARLAASGPIVRTGDSIAGTPTDVAPTILHALGVPIARDLAGTPLTGLFRQEFSDRYPVRPVATYGSPAPSSGPRQGRPLDQEMIDRLRSLGYVR
jgi:Type I phosphodiesterase / nucleotide pyrophosphatase